MSRRQAIRRPRRVQVSFWRRGEPTPYIGYTTNISMTGMFIATNSPMAGGSRIRVEVVDRDRGFMVEGVVAHARKMSADMSRVSHSGMGVRFLTVEELVRELMPSVLGSTAAIPHSPAPPNTVTEPEVPEPLTFETPSEPLATPVLRRRTDAFPASPAPSPPPIAPPVVGEGAFSVHFTSAEEFLEVYRRDILQGGLFVSTLHPARIQESVTVELYPPLPGVEAITLRARVVHRFEPHSADAGGHNLLSGMGLELLDLPALVERLHPVVNRLRK